MEQAGGSHDIGARLQRLEREMRQWRRATIGLLLGIPVFLMVSEAARAARPATLEAEQFVVRDANGRVRARLGLVETSESSVVGGRAGSTVGGVGGIPDLRSPRKGLGPGLQLYDREGDGAVVELLLHVDGAPSLVLSQPKLHASANLSVDSAGAIILRMCRAPECKDGKVLLSLQEESPYLILTGRGNKALFRVP